MHVREMERPHAALDQGSAPGWLVAWALNSARRRHEDRKAAAGLLAMGERLLRDVGISRADAERLGR
jgi:uncharacterized protein YjiS (DUF1127 family)